MENNTETTMQIPNKEIEKGSIVLYKTLWYNVTAIFKNGTANLSSPRGSRILYKGIPISELKEDYDNWYNRFVKSETYQSM